MREARLTARGHAEVTGRHDKTLELTAEDAITARATCVLGVAAGPLPGDLPLLRGRVRLTLAAGGHAGSVDGEVNPGYVSADRLVVRRSDQLDPATYLVNASAAAADLDPDLLAALRDPGAAAEVTVAELGTPAPVLLVLLPGPAPGPDVARIAAEADTVVDLTGRGAAPPTLPLTAPRRHGSPGDLTGLRTIVVLAEHLGQLPGPAVPPGPTPGGGGPQDTARPAPGALPVGRVVLWPPLPGAELLLAAGRAPVPLLHAGALPAARELVPLLADVPAVFAAAAEPQVAALRELLPAAPACAPARRSATSPACAATPGWSPSRRPGRRGSRWTPPSSPGSSALPACRDATRPRH